MEPGDEVVAVTRRLGDRAAARVAAARVAASRVTTRKMGGAKLYQEIVNPQTGGRLIVNSKEGQNLINKYLKFLGYN